MANFPLLKMHRNFTLNTTMGHSVFFAKNIPTYVPRSIYQLALAAGAFPAEEGEVVPDFTPNDGVDDPTDPGERAARIMSAIEAIVARNNREDFTAAGSPSVQAVKDRAGFKMSSKEIAVQWQLLHDKLANEKLDQ